MGTIFGKDADTRASNVAWFQQLNYEEYTELYDANIFEYEFNEIGILMEGVSFQITGFLLLDCERFTIDFVSKEKQNIPLHINVRIPHNYVIRNCRIGDVWGSPEIASALPFILRRGAYFSIEILVTSKCYMIAINNNHYAQYDHRCRYESVNYIQVKGDLHKVLMVRRRVKSYPHMRLEVCKRLRVDTSFILNTLYDKEFDEEVEELSIDERLITLEHADRASRHTLNPIQEAFRLPYYGCLEPSFTIGSCIKIDGRARVLPHSFSISLQCGNQVWPYPNVAFHFNPRYLEKVESSTYQQVLVCNSYSDGQWSNELRFELQKEFSPGRTFSLTIVCNKRCYEVYVNQRWFMDFKHRVAPDGVNTLFIEGDIKIWNVVLDNFEWKSIQDRYFKQEIQAAESLKHPSVLNHFNEVD